jgi:hypothetical protein
MAENAGFAERKTIITKPIKKERHSGLCGVPGAAPRGVS